MTTGPAKKIYGENKLITEEAMVGGLLSAAVGGCIASIVMSTDLLRAFVAHRLPLFSSGVTQAAWSEYINSYGLANITLAIVAGIVAVAFVAGFTFFGFQRSRWHLDGMEYFEDPDAGAKRMQSNETALMSSKQRDKKNPDRPAGINIGGVELSRTREVGHLSIVGLPGSGKTVIINNIIAQVLERRERIMLHDPKGDFTSWLYNERDTVLLGPWDTRASCWDIAADIDNAELATTFAAAMVEGEGGGDKGGGGQFFDDAATVIIGGLLKSYLLEHGKEWSWDTLADDLSNGPHAMYRQAVKGDPLVALLVSDYDKPKHNDKTDSVTATVAKAVSWVLAYAGTYKVVRRSDKTIDRDASRMFAIKKWLANEANTEVKKVVFNNDKNYEKRSQQIFGAMIAAAANYINSSAMPEISADAAGLWLVLDEFPQLGAGAGKYIQQIEELGRSRGVRVIKAMQDESQLFAQSGREKGEAQKSVQQTRVYCKLATGTASELSKKLGDKQFVRVEFPQVIGAGNKRIVHDKEPVIRVEALTGLRILKEPVPVGVEMIAHSDDVLVKLVQRFIDQEIVKERHPKVIQNEEFATAALRYAAAANRVRDQRAVADGKGVYDHLLSPDSPQLDDEDIPTPDETPYDDGDDGDDISINI